jgi:hypothetical protein
MLAVGGCLAAVFLGGLALAGSGDPAPKSTPPLDSAGQQRLQDYLATVPEIDLNERGPDARTEAGKKGLLDQVQAIKTESTHRVDGFVERLMQKRPDLAGLRFAMAKDCTLAAKQAQQLTAMADRIRFSLSAAGPAAPPEKGSGARGRFDADLFWGLMSDWETNALPGEESIRALQQLLCVEDRDVRRSLVRYLHLRKGKTSTVALTQHVLFDLDPQVRADALKALKTRSAEEYAPVLVEGLRYPWAAVADRAARALAALEVKQAVPNLKRLLEQQDPGAPVVKRKGGSEVPVVRELVRVNHFGNCLMCHPVSSDSKDLVRGQVPVPGEPMVSPSVYGSTPDGIFVRADITYLRPDFSVMRAVSNPGKWPARQRFDYLVRERELTGAERAAWQADQKLAQPRPISEHRRAFQFALRELTEARTEEPVWGFLKGLSLRKT